MKRFQIVFIVLTVLGVGMAGPNFLPPLHATTPPASFPGAEGFGAESVGGRYGTPTIYVVDTLLDVVDSNDGLTSLREAVQAQGPRFVVFSVSGVIVLNQRLSITNPYITIAGQTAPSPGITLAHFGISITDPCHDVVIRYLRFRGFFIEGDDRTKMGSILFGSYDNLVYNVIIDHCSLAWAHDEGVLAWGKMGKFTLQWSFITEMCGWAEDAEKIISSAVVLGFGECQTNIKGSIHHNLMAHNRGAIPSIHGANIVDVRNNIVYSWYNNNSAIVDNWTDLGATNPTLVNFVNNYFIEGKDVSDVTQHKLMIEVPEPIEDPNVKIFAEGNLAPLKPYPLSPEWGVGNIAYWDSGRQTMQDADSAVYGSTTAATAPYVNTSPAIVALYHVLDRAGMSYPIRDSLDSRIVSEVLYVTANYSLLWNPLAIDVPKCVADSNLGYTAPNEGPGDPDRMRSCGVPYQFPTLSNITALTSGITPGTAPLDSDNDGIPDQWETQHGLNPLNATDSILDSNSDGYLNIEEYINSLVVDSSI